MADADAAAPAAPSGVTPVRQQLFPTLTADKQMQDTVREALMHAWKNYRRYAWGADNLKPISHSSSNGFLSTCVTSHRYSVSRRGRLIHAEKMTFFSITLSSLLEHTVGYLQR